MRAALGFVKRIIVSAYPSLSRRKIQDLFLTLLSTYILTIKGMVLVNKPPAETFPPYYVVAVSFVFVLI